MGLGYGQDQHQHGIWSDALKEPTVNHPGAYRSVCVELDVYGLAVAAIMNSALLDAEGLTGVSVTGGGGRHGAAAAAADAGDPSGVPGGAGNGYDSDGPVNTFYASGAAVSSDASVARAFNILKASVAKWIHETQVRRALFTPLSNLSRPLAVLI